MKHTPTPWAYEHEGQENGFMAGEVYSTAGASPAIATCHSYVGGDSADGTKGLEIEARANAAFIVRACNAHEELVALAGIAHARLFNKIHDMKSKPGYSSDERAKISVSGLETEMTRYATILKQVEAQY